MRGLRFPAKSEGLGWRKSMQGKSVSCTATCLDPPYLLPVTGAISHSPCFFFDLVQNLSLPVSYVARSN